MTSKLYCGDCVQIIPTVEDNTIDLVVTSPPYNVNLGHNKYNKNAYNTYQDNKEHKEYILWLRGIFESIYPKLKCGGRVVINIGDGKNGAVPTSSDIIQFMQELTYIPITHIIWNKNQTSPRTAWGSFMSPSCVSYPTPFEHVLIFAKESKKLQHQGKTDLAKQEFIDWSLALWSFNGEKSKFGHPAPFPEELPKRCIKMNTYIGDTVLDPFMGSGTTGVVCQRLQRNFIGIEIDEKYYQVAKSRIQEVEMEQVKNVFNYTND